MNMIHMKKIPLKMKKYLKTKEIDIPDDEEMIDQCLETVNEVQTMANERSKMLLSNGKLAYE